MIELVAVGLLVIVVAAAFVSWILDDHVRTERFRDVDRLARKDRQ